MFIALEAGSNNKALAERTVRKPLAVLSYHHQEMQNA